jgi:hypothetical protein
MCSFEKGFSLRQRKQARTKILIVKEFLQKLKEEKYEDIGEMVTKCCCSLT